MKFTRFNLSRVLVPVCSLVVLLMATSTQPGISAENEPDSVEYSDWIFDGYVELAEVPEPSGMCYHPGRNSLFLVDDGAINPDGSVRIAALFEIDLTASVLSKLEIGNDLEGVCWCSWDGMLYVCDEIDETVYVVDPDGLTVEGSFQVSREFDGEPLLAAGGNGFEGIEYIDGSPGAPGYFLLLNQDDPHALVRVEYEETIKPNLAVPVPIKSYKLLPQINLGELHYDRDERELWVVHSWMNVIEILDIDSLHLKRWEVCPGAAQEALAFDSEGRLWIGYDLGGLSRYVRPADATLVEATE